jgi:nitroreductase
MLQATELGLSTCWLGAFSEPAVRELLRIPEDYVIIAVTPLGYAAEEGRARSRNTLETFVVKESF